MDESQETSDIDATFYSKCDHESELFFDAEEEDNGQETKTIQGDLLLESVEEDTEEDDDVIGSEPKLKYERLSSDLKHILANESCTAIAVHPKFIVLGTNWGRLYLLDALGNQMPSSSLENKFSVDISQISVDHSGEFVAACSASEGKVAIMGLYTKENNYTMTVGASVGAVAIDPIYARAGSGKRFMTGDDRTTLHEKTYFSRYKPHCLSDPSDGPVSCLSWRGRFAAWAGRRGVVVYDVVEEKVISLVKFKNVIPPEASKDDCQYLCRIAWADQFSLYISAGDVINVCAVKRRDPNEVKLKDLPEHFVEIQHVLVISDLWICGVAPMNEYLVVLAVPKESSHEKRPQLLIVEPHDEGLTEISTDLLSLRGFESYRPCDYHLDFLLDDQHYFVISPKDVIVGKPRGEDDHIDWLLEHGSYSAALEFAEQKSKLLKRHTVLKVGRSYLDHLIENTHFDEAGKLCTRLYANNQKLWQEEIVRFGRLNQLVALAPYIPLGCRDGKEDIHLEQFYYEMVLQSCLKSEKDVGETFLELVRKWPSDLYNVSKVAKLLVEELLVDPDNVMLQRSLATLFSYQKKYDKAMAMYLKLGHKDVFQLIRRHDLFGVIFDKIPDLLELDEREAIKLFLEHPEKISSDTIVQHLLGYDKHLHSYLDALLVNNYEASKKYHGLLIGLYADYNPDKLMPFLKSSDHYPIQEALEACEIRGLTPERIFILARMGNTRQALHLITRELADIHRAVEFCKEYDDVDLWNDLIEYSIDKPYFVNVLLHNIGTHVDPAILIKRIECGQKIPGLRDSLVQIMHDFHLQVSLQEGCKKILVSDCFALIQRQVKCQSRGTAVIKDTICGGCLSPIIEPRHSKSSDAVVFMCRHAFHAECIADDSSQCSLCKGAK